MSNKINSFKKLKKAFHNSNLSEGVLYCKRGQYADAVRCFDTVKDLASLDTESKSYIKASYYIHGKFLQHQRQFIAALDCFQRARQCDPNDFLLLERTKLLISQYHYKTWENIGEFRKAFGFGFTSGGFQKYQYPFLKIAKQKGVLQQPQRCAESNLIGKIYTIGVYRIQAQGRHLLSYKIREYKKQGNSKLALPFAWLLADFIKGMTELIKIVDIMVPSAANPNKYVERGFIPSLLIAKELSKCLAIPYRELFHISPMAVRFRDISYAEGKKLIRYRDSQCSKLASDNTVVLLDDVVTTARTLTLFADVLKSAGAKEVYAIALAKTGAPVTD